MKLKENQFFEFKDPRPSLNVCCNYYGIFVYVHLCMCTYMLVYIKNLKITIGLTLSSTAEIIYFNIILK